jgi:hypothetical protein
VSTVDMVLVVNINCVTVHRINVLCCEVFCNPLVSLYDCRTFFNVARKTICIFLAYFPKMKVGLSNHQSVCVCVCVSVSVSLPVCPPLITTEPLGRFLMIFGREVMPFNWTSIQ